MAEATVSQVKGCRWVSVWYRALMLTTDVTFSQLVLPLSATSTRKVITSPLVMRQKGQKATPSNEKENKTWSRILLSLCYYIIHRHV